jgi:hypothetical protein
MRPSDSERPSLARRGLHLWALSGFAFAQPLFDLLGRNATFFVARASPPLDILTFAGLLLVALPLGLWLVEVALDAIAPRASWYLHLAFVGVLGWALVQTPLLRALGGGATLVAAAAGLVAAVSYSRSAGMRAFLGFLAPAPLLFAAWFLARAEVRSLVWPRPPLPFAAHTSSRVPVVFVLLDEISTSSLMRPDGAIEERMFPAFARLARDAVWFRNATSMMPMTDFVVPVILSGIRHATGLRLPIYETTPNSLFTLLAGSHRIVAWESVTALCPPNVCEDLLPLPPLGERIGALGRDAALVYAHLITPESGRSRLPPIDHAWGGFGAPRGNEPARPVRNREGRLRHMRQLNRNRRETPFGIFRSFIDAIDPKAPPTLYFLHVLLPHVPWRAFPSGTLYDADDRPDGTEGLMKTWSSDAWPSEIGFQRYLLQLGYLDRLLGELLDRLEETGLYDRSLLVVVGDHGVTFRPGQMYRQPTDESVRDLMHVPLFVKLPGERGGRVSDRNVESIDVLPTVADALDVAVPFPVQGSSALADTPERPRKKMYAGGQEWEFPAAPPARWPALDRKRELFGDAGRWEQVEHFAARPELVGRPVAQARLAPDDGSTRGQVERLDRFAAVDTDSGVLPAYVRGQVRSDGEPPTEVALALNGKVWAVGATFARAPGTARFSLLVPEAAFRPGRNDVRLYAVGKDGGLRPIPVSNA